MKKKKDCDINVKNIIGDINKLQARNPMPERSYFVRRLSDFCKKNGRTKFQTNELPEYILTLNSLRKIKKLEEKYFR